MSFYNFPSPWTADQVGDELNITFLTLYYFIPFYILVC